MEGMTMISFQNFSFRYEESKDFTLRGIDMTVRTGEFILLTGRSGCGKTTLIRSLNGLIPHFYPGEIKGDLLMDGHSLLEMKPSELAGQVGTVFQDPRSQFFMTDTTRELAFGCENLGLAREETIDRIARAAKELELVEYLNRSIFALSSGEKQQIAISSVYAGYRLSTLCQQRGRRAFPWNAGRLQRKNRCSIERIGTVGLSGKTPSIAFRRSKTTGYHWSGNRKGQPRNLLRRAHQRLGL